MCCTWSSSEMECGGKRTGGGSPHRSIRHDPLHSNAKVQCEGSPPLSHTGSATYASLPDPAPALGGTCSTQTCATQRGKPQDAPLS
jgi:hypothetical protein